MKPHSDELVPHGADETCGWCSPARHTGLTAHQRFIKTLEDNLNALRAELHTERVKNERLRYELEQARGRTV